MTDTATTDIAPAKPTLEVIELSDEEFDTLSKSTRKVSPSPLLEQVRAATVGKANGVPIPEGTTSRTIVNYVTKAAKELNLKVQVITRENATPPIVVFKVLGPQTDKA